MIGCNDGEVPARAKVPRAFGLPTSDRTNADLSEKVQVVTECNNGAEGTSSSRRSRGMSGYLSKSKQSQEMN